jgi:hypothetical protein
MNLLSKYRNSLLAAFLMAASLAPAANAQSTVGRINVPFAFDCGTQHYAAGEYNIQTAMNGVLSIGNSAGSGLVMPQREQNTQRTATGKAVFRVYGDRYFLSELWTKGEATHFTFQPSKAEHEVQLALKRTPGSGVQMALLTVPR